MQHRSASNTHRWCSNSTPSNLVKCSWMLCHPTVIKSANPSKSSWISLLGIRNKLHNNLVRSNLLCIRSCQNSKCNLISRCKIKVSKPIQLEIAASVLKGNLLEINLWLMAAKCRTAQAPRRPTQHLQEYNSKNCYPNKTFSCNSSRHQHRKCTLIRSRRTKCCQWNTSKYRMRD